MSDPDGAAVIPASRYPHGYASVRSLARAGVDTIAAVSDERLPITASRFCDEVVLIPPASDLPAYRDALLELAARPDVRTIVPHRPQDPYLLSKHYEEFDRHIDTVIPPFETLRAVHDRLHMLDVAEEAGLPVPETERLDEVEEWTAARIIKARYNLLVEEYADSFGPEESEVPKSIHHVPAGKTPDVAAVAAEMNHVPIVQEYVDGADAYVFGALYDHGEPVATFQHRQLRADSYAGGGGVYRETVDIPDLEEVGRTILDRLDWHGLACNEYIRDADTGEFKLIEINPRMWQSLPCATRSGAAFPYWYWLQATGRPESIAPGYETGVRSHYLAGELEHLLSIRRKDAFHEDRPSLPKRAGEILRSCGDTPAFDYLRLDDPGPVLRQVRTEAGRSLRRRTS